jgi:hypothetical protein
MSYRYTEIIVPEVGHFGCRPSARQLAAVVDVLAAEGWVHPHPEDSMYVSVDEAKAAVQLADRDAVSVCMLAAATEPAPDEWPPTEPVFTPDLCEDVLLVSSPTLLLLPGSMNGGVLACPNCESDMASADNVPRAHELAANGLRLAPVQCPACRSAANLADLVLAAGDFEDEAPFYHFALYVTAVREPTVELVYMDPELLSVLGEACGVPLRSTGRLR